MVNYDYKSVLLETIKSKCGMDITWDDISVSTPISTNGATATVTLTPTETVAFKGTVNVQIKRMVVDNQDLIFTNYYSNKTQNSDVFIIKSVPKTAAEFLSLLSERLGVALTSDDFDVPSLPSSVDKEILVTLKAKATSRYFYGTLRVRFLPELINTLIFDCDLATPLTVYKTWLASAKLIVDGVAQDMSLATWVLPAGKHRIEMLGLLSTPYRLYNYNPTKLVSFRFFDTNVLIGSVMAACTNLTEIAEDAFYVLGGVFTAFFQKCSGLKTLPKRLFADGCIADGIDWLFVESGITTIPATLFNDLQVRSPTLDMIFGSCPSLTDVPVGLFTNFGTVKTFSRMFMQTGVTTAKRGVFSGLTSVTSFSDAYANCRQLKTVEVGALSGMPALTTEQRTFSNCTQLATVNAPLFSDSGASTALVTLTNTFASTVGLKQVPENLLAGCDHATIISGLLRGSGITSIPEKMFTYTPSLVQLLSAFSGCASLAAIPKDLLTPVVKLVYLTSCFSSATAIKVIPPTLLSTIPNLGIVESLFDGCTELTGIPSDLFSNNAKLVNVTNLFRNVPVEFTIPANFFPGVAITKASGVFMGSGLKAIEGGLFSRHTKLNTAEKAFSNTLLTKVPKGTISSTDATFISFVSLFEGCVNLVEVEVGAIVATATPSASMTVRVNSLFAGCTALATLGNGAVVLTGSIVALDYVFSECSSLRISTTKLGVAFVTNMQLVDSSTLSAIGFCSGVIWLTGSCMEMWNKLTNNELPGTKRVRTNFVENCFLLDDYEDVGKAWWSTPISLARANDNTLDVFKLGSVKPPSGHKTVPLYSSYYINIPRDTLSSSFGVLDNETITGPMRLWLAKIFLALGLEIPTQITTMSLVFKSYRDISFPTAAVRSDVKLVGRLVFNRSATAADWTNTDTYLLCSTTI